MFANHAEETGGLLLLTGATWDTINVNAPLAGELPPGVKAVTAINGSLVVRLLFHRTETNQDHNFSLRLISMDGEELQKLDGQFHVAWSEDNPLEWDQGVNIIIGLTGMPLPDFGQYTFHLLVDNAHMAERPFRVVKRY
jgi:hypothetical protein